jgi:hypothetical protein
LVFQGHGVIGRGKDAANEAPHPKCICRSVAIAGTSLTAWVVETFSTIEKHGPPIRGADR